MGIDPCADNMLEDGVSLGGLEDYLIPAIPAAVLLAALVLRLEFTQQQFNSRSLMISGPIEEIEGWFDVAWFRRKQPKQPAKIVRNFTGQPKRYGKKRLPTRKTGGAQRRFDKKLISLRKSGYVMASKSQSTT